MQRFRFYGLMLMIPVLVFLAASAGCGGGKDAPKDGAKASTPSGDKDKTGTSGSTKKGLEAVASKGTATIKGQVTYDGDAPKEKLAFTEKAEKRCHEGDTEKLTWEVDPNSKGVKNVVIWVKPGDGRYFAVPDSAKKRTDKVEMDQPYCNFTPHVVALQPSYFDGTKQVATGQNLTVKNSAPITHNTKLDGNPAITENSRNEIINAGDSRELAVKPCRDNQAGREERIGISCTIHPWMTAVVWAFDHPYYVLTDKDGKFEIKDVPADAEIYIVAWHEEAGKNNFILPQASPSPQGDKIKLTAGETKEISFKIKKQ